MDKVTTPPPDRQKIEPNFSFDTITAADIKAEADQYNESQNGNLFIIKPASAWLQEAATKPIPKMLFGEFWYENEACCLFASSNVGKSILAVQIANSITSGSNTLGLEPPPAQKVIYFDFEMTEKQFELRYSDNYTDHYTFSPNFLRAELDPDADLPDDLNFENYLIQCIEQSITTTGAKVLIIDNITYMRNETEKASKAAVLMKEIKSLKIKYGLSVLVLAHTPKRDATRPITRNDLQGSANLYNFLDSAFAIGESSTDGNTRYIKQVKVRNGAFIYDGENVMTCTIGKPYNFLAFDFHSFEPERRHLKTFTNEEADDIEAKVLELQQAGKSYRAIGEELKISHMKVKRIAERNKV